MKRIALYLGIAIASMVSCTVQEENYEAPRQDEVCFLASFEQPAEESKVYVNEDLYLRWTADDRVSIFNQNTYNQQFVFTGETGDNAGSFIEADASESATGNPLSHVVSVYPYQRRTVISEKEVLTVTLPSQQSYAGNTFGLGANTMVSVSTDNVLQFKNVCGYLRIRLYGEGCTVSSISLKGNHGELLAGRATISMPLDGTPTATFRSDATDEITLVCDTPVALGPTAADSKDFWFVVPPVTFSQGFTIKVTDPDGGVVMRSTSKSITIERNELSKMSPMNISTPAGMIVFVDAAVKSICVENWDTDRDGELSYDEAAAVTTLGMVFEKNKAIKYFDELAYFTGLTELAVREFFSCSSLESITLPMNLKNIGSRAMRRCAALSRVVCLSPEPCQIGLAALLESDNAQIYVPEGTACLYQDADGWRTYAARITEEGHEAREFFYSSTDYSMDGEVLCLQEATEGKGIDLVFLGDGFVDKELGPGGHFETLMARWMEQFFIYEPFASFRNWFNVYAVKVVSKNYVYQSTDSDRALTYDNSWGVFSCRSDVCLSYARKVPTPTGRYQWVATFVNYEENVGRNSFCTMSPINCYAYILDGIDYRPSVLNHELGGHGFAKLADEYPDGNTGAPDDPQELVESYYSWDAWSNVDWRNDPSTVRWSHFLNDSRYDPEQLGFFEGAATYALGIYRPTENSMMRDDFAKGIVFNPPSREAIYKFIMRWGVGEDWEYDYETFVAVDEAGRKQAQEFAQATSKAPARDPLMDQERHHLPPILTDESVKEIHLSPEGKVSLVR